jgi:hypothetical protein
MIGKQKERERKFGKKPKSIIRETWRVWGLKNIEFGN